MTVLWSTQAENALAQHRTAPGPPAYDRLVRRLIALENDAMLFQLSFGVVELDTPLQATGAGPLRVHLMEAEPGAVFTIFYRLAVDSEDVWIVGLHHGQ